EPRKAYDRVHLSSYFSHHTAEELSLVRDGFYEKHGVKVLVGDTSDYGNLLQLVLNGIELPENPDALILPAHASSGKPSI
ncbi:hypothetical protein NGC23_21980, partial [Leclercia pneumoniae]|uniref:hypothetical protein n=1 Tax=Leclercia pneumoniae TaxID=2815358 RepID=UPI002DB6B4FF